MTDKVAILIEEKFNELELVYPYYRLLEAGYEVHTIGSGKSDSYHGKYGMPFGATHAIEEIAASDYAGVIIPGGFAPDYMRRVPAMAQLVAEIYNAGKPTAAICHGGWLLASADIVENKVLTSFFSINVDMRNAGAEWVDKPVVVDGNLITSRKPDDLPAFMQQVLKLLAGGKEETK